MTSIFAACSAIPWLLSYVLNPSKYRHSLDNVALDYLDHKMISFKDVAGTGKKAVTFDKVEIEKASEYACEDSDVTSILSKLLFPKAEGGERRRELYDSIEMPLIEVLAKMEIHGVRLDMEFLQALSEGVRHQAGRSGKENISRGRARNLILNQPNSWARSSLKNCFFRFRKKQRQDIRPMSQL